MLNRRVTIDTIKRAVADRFQIKQVQLRQRGTTQRIVFPRQVAMYLVDELAVATLPEIGRAFGVKRHTAVMNSIAKISKLRQTDGDLNRLINAIIDTVQ